MFDYRVISVPRLDMARTIAAASLAGALLVTLSGTAEAQFFGWWGSAPAYGVPENAVIPPGDIYRIVAAHGYQVVGVIPRNGRNYMVDVIDPRGRSLRLVVDAYEGEITQRFAIAPLRPPASIPQSQANLYPQYPSYPPYPAAYPPQSPSANGEPGAAPSTPRKTANETHRKPSKKTRTATREPAPAARAAHSQDAAPTETSVPQPAAKVEPDSAAATPAPAKSQSATAAAVTPSPAAVSAPAQPTAPKKDGPGYANGVPINPLD